MAATPTDAVPPRRSRRATLALIASFIVATTLVILGHVDRMATASVDDDPGGRQALPADDSSRWPAPVAVGVSAGMAVGIDVDVDVAALPQRPAFDAPVAGIVMAAASAPAQRGDDVSVHLVAPVAWKQALAPGSAFQFHVDQTGRRHHGRVLRLDEDGDPAQRTVRVVGAVVDDGAALLPGMRGSARFGDRAPGAQR